MPQTRDWCKLKNRIHFPAKISNRLSTLFYFFSLYGNMKMRKKNFRATNTLDLADSTSSKTNTLDNIKLIYIERINIIVNILEKEKTYLRHQQNGSKRINLTIVYVKRHQSHQVVTLSVPRQLQRHLPHTTLCTYSTNSCTVQLLKKKKKYSIQAPHG